MYNNTDTPRLIVSYLTLRRALGALGLLLPPMLALGCLAFGTCDGIEDSISDYYATEMRDVLVGVLFTIGWFMFAYKGYDRRDDVAGDLAWLFALGTALCPNSSPNAVISTLHFVFAASLFLLLSYFALFLFTKFRGSLTEAKKKRNRIYVTCGVVILACIALIAIYFLFLSDTAVAAIKPVFWLESLALWAFGISWLIKGETLCKDPGA